MEQVHVGTEGGKPAAKVTGLLGPLTLRDTVVVSGAVLVLIGSLIPIPWTKTASVNMWIFPGLPFHLLVALLLPLAVGAGFAWRRLANRTRVRVGSLSLDQFGSVTAMISGAYFFNSYAATTSPAYLIGLFGSVAMLLGTTLARYFGVFRRDFVPGDESVITADVLPLDLAAATAAPAAAAPGSAAGDLAETFGATGPGGPAKSAPLAPQDSEAAPAADKQATGAPAVFAAAAPVAASAAPVAVGAATDAPKQEDPSAEPSDEGRQAPAGSEVPQTDTAATGSAASEAAETDAAAANSESSASAGQEAVKESASAAAETALAAGGAAEDAGSEEQPDAPAAADAADSTPGDAAAKESAASADAEAESKQATPEAQLPGINLNQEDPGADDGSAEDAAVPTGLIASSEPAKAAGQQPETPAPPRIAEAAVPATSATPVAPVAHQATAALSREDLAVQMAKAASQKANEEEHFGARAELIEPEAETKSFWFALNQPRPVYHPVNGAMITTLQPGVWILCLEDRGQDYLVNLDGDRPAVLRELDNLQFPDK